MTTEIQEPPPQEIASEPPATRTPQVTAGPPPAAPPPPFMAAGVERERRRRWWPWLLVAAGIGLALYAFTHRAGSQQAAAGGKGGAAAAPRAVPVLAATVRRGDMPVYLTGLGTAAAANTVTVKTRVDGQLVRVHFQEGQLVQQGALVAELDPRAFQVQLMQAEGQLAKDEAALKNARLDLQRYQVLAQEDSIPRQQLDTQAAIVNQDEGAIKTDQGTVASARLNLAYTRITAPTTGRVGLRLVDAGNIVHASDPNGLLVITQVQPIVVVFTIPADQLPEVQRQLHAGQTLTVEAYDRELRQRLAGGSLLAVDNQIDASTGTVRLKAVFENKDDALFPNQFVNARLLVSVLRGATLVPTAAIQRTAQSTIVYVVGPDNAVRSHPVDIALTEGDVTAVRGGVQPGETVVTDGLDKLQDGMKVTIASAAPAAGPRGTGPRGAGGRAGRGGAPGASGAAAAPGAGAAPGAAPGNAAAPRAGATPGGRRRAAGS